MNLVEKLLKGGLIAAHRGHRALFPENTMAAFADCVNQCDFIELDVRFSKDCVPLVFHDPTLERTTDIHKCGLFPGREDHQIESFSYSELKQLDVGSWFYQADPHGQIARGNAIVPPPEKRPQSIPLLSDVLAFVRDNKLAVNVEIKQLHKDEVRSVTEIVRAVYESGLVENCVLSAFDHAIVAKIKQTDAQLTTAALVEGEHPDNLIEYLKALGVSGYHIHDDMVTPEVFAAIAESGLFVCVYTVNSASRKKELIQMGASAVISDYL